MNFRLPFWVENGGDGSASVNFTPTSEEAERSDREQSEGWGESSASNVDLKIEGDQIYFKRRNPDTYKEEWLPVPKN